MVIHIRHRCSKSLSCVFPAACQCEQPEISMYCCKVNELFPNLPSLLGGEFSGFKLGKLWAGSAVLSPPLKRMPARWLPLSSAIFGHMWGTHVCSLTLSSLFHIIQPAKHISQPMAEEFNVFLWYWALHLTISSRLSLIQTSANAHLDYCVFYWRNCNGDVLLMFGKQCVYLPFF